MSADTPTPNVDLLRRTLAHIEANPAEWEQSVYRCKTGMCFAGWAATLDGGQWADATDVELIARDSDPAEFLWPGDPATIDVWHRARQILGITGDQAEELFDGSNGLDELRRIVAELTGGDAR